MARPVAAEDVTTPCVEVRALEAHPPATDAANLPPVTGLVYRDGSGRVTGTVHVRVVLGIAVEGRGRTSVTGLAAEPCWSSAAAG
ncbi:hypothetical protein ACFRCI_41270 [Streptomyces sp. NPDC056638]|uniref:hypothetical protein n=1 Tax=Streptomyces sp. NPDC056638 TaxID=3345887 RepID=UPI0036C9A7C9